MLQALVLRSGGLARALRSDDSGQGSAEYIIIIGMVLGVIVMALKLFADGLQQEAARGLVDYVVKLIGRFG